MSIKVRLAPACARAISSRIGDAGLDMVDAFACGRGSRHAGGTHARARPLPIGPKLDDDCIPYGN